MSDELTIKPAADDLEIQRFARLGQWLAAAEGKPPAEGAACALRLYLTHELGLPLRAAGQVTLIKGRLNVGVELQRAIARRSGYDVKRLEIDDTRCIAVVVNSDTGQQVGDAVTFTIEMAEKAGLIKSGGAWETYPQRMLWARAAGWAMKDAIPEVVMGLSNESEKEEMAGGQLRPHADIEVDREPEPAYEDGDDVEPEDELEPDVNQLEIVDA